jgi:Mce-associated membrane protein
VTSRAPAQDRRRLVVAWGLSVLLVVTLAGLVVAAVALRQQKTRADTRSAVMQSARQTTLDFTTYKYQTWDADAQRVLDGATGPFKEEFAGALASVKTEVVAGKATSTGEILEAAVQSMDVDSAQVLVVADAVVTNTAADTARRRHYRMKLELVREGDRWLVADLQAVG